MGDNPLMQAGLQMGLDQAHGTVSRYLPGFALFWAALQMRMQVDNEYVSRKLGIVLFPFLSRNWHREVSELT